MTSKMQPPPARASGVLRWLLGLAMLALAHHPAAAQVAADTGAACPTPDAASRQGGSADIVVELDPATIWRPRGSEVRVVVSGNGIAVSNLRACFAWSSDGAATPVGILWAPRPSPLVRTVTDAAGKIEYGITVPELPTVPGIWPFRAWSDSPQRFTGWFTVPLADLHVMATVHVNGHDMPVSVVLPVGVTDVVYALAVLAISLAVAAVALMRAVSGARLLPPGSALLKLICNDDGQANLSQFQIMLWTTVVAGAAIYVMALSGNLIGITNGTLVLLGIASAAALLARIPSSSEPPVVKAADGTVRTPRWSDLVVVEQPEGASEIDVTRVQMLIFTVISAVFVVIKVITSYEIPVIPDNFLLLMGVSNGVYVTGRHLPR